MRLWHYKLLRHLPQSQLIAQWRELNSIYKKQDKHILINYIYEYPKEHLFVYSNLVIKELTKRGVNISYNNYNDYFADILSSKNQGLTIETPFELHHNERYLLQCFYNLQEKYDRGQKDFKESQYTLIDLLFYAWTK